MRLWACTKYLTIVLLTIAAVSVMVWLIWVPGAKEPAYVFVAAWGEKGSAPGQFNDPTGITVTKTEVFVSDARNAQIQVFDYEGHFIRQFGSKGVDLGQLGRLTNLSIAGNELYVADGYNDRIQVFSASGTFLLKWGGPFALNIFRPFNGWFCHRGVRGYRSREQYTFQVDLRVG